MHDMCGRGKLSYQRLYRKYKTCSIMNKFTVCSRLYDYSMPQKMCETQSSLKGYKIKTITHTVY